MARHTLLVADDSRTVQRIVEMACAGDNLHVVSVDDGDAAIAHIEARPPDIVLADIAMPRRSGYDVAAFVKGRSDLSHIPVLLMAGMFESADDGRARSSGCAETLTKPLKPQQVAERVRYWLEAPPQPVVHGSDAPANGAEGTPPETARAHADPTEDYFSRLDAAFKTLERPLGVKHDGSQAGAVDEPGAGRVEPVPTLQELSNRLPQETRTRLTPPPSPAEPPNADASSAEADAAVIDAIANRLLDHLARRDDLLDEIARRLAQRQDPAAGPSGH
jgi:CheY-like chemotaxis protein